MSDGLTLEKAKVVERLSELELSNARMETKFDIVIQQIQENNTKLNHIIIGNGEQGIVDKVRTLESAQEKRTNYSKAAWLAIIGLACKSVWDTIVGK